MKTKHLKRLCLHVGLASSLAITSLEAQSALSFERFQSKTLSRSDYDYINIEALLFHMDSGVRVGIYNNTVPSGSGSSMKPTVTSIFFDTASPLLGSTPTFNAGISSPGIDFVFGGSPPNLPGGSEIGFSADAEFTAAPPPPKNGLNPGDFAYFDFADMHYAHLVGGINEGKVRFGVHVLQVGSQGEDSVPLVTSIPATPLSLGTEPIPEPSSLLLGMLAALLFLGRKNR